MKSAVLDIRSLGSGTNRVRGKTIKEETGEEGFK